MYAIVLSLHNIVRWLALIAAVFAVMRAISGWVSRSAWTPSSAGPGRIFTISLDVQFLIGILLYAVLSPVTKAAFADMASAMGQREIRFFVAEHAVFMVLALVAAHMGKVLAPKGATDTLKYRRAAIWYGLATLLMLAGMPWWRPLFRLG
ncbi:MAG: hypothetical protein ACYC2G_13945 [Gemmatimonadaceae bacterium]